MTYWIGLDGITLSEINQMKEGKTGGKYELTYMWNLKS